MYSFCIKGRRHEYGRTPNIGEHWNSALFGWEAWLTPPDMCYHVKFGSSATKGEHINRKEPQKLGSAWAQPPCGRGVVDPLEPLKYTSPHMGYSAEFGRSRSKMLIFGH